MLGIGQPIRFKGMPYAHFLPKRRSCSFLGDKLCAIFKHAFSVTKSHNVWSAIKNECHPNAQHAIWYCGASASRVCMGPKMLA